MNLDDSAAREHDAREKQAAEAVVLLRAYADKPTAPTNAETVAIVRLLCKVAINLIKHIFNRE